jgi:hypothetical protein
LTSKALDEDEEDEHEDEEDAEEDMARAELNCLSAD